MRIKTTITVDSPSGFYCKRNGKTGCCRIGEQANRPYCEVFYPFLETDSRGNIIKCEACLLAEREARSEV